MRLFRLLRDTELTVTELTDALAQSQPGISRHLKLLCEAGLVERRQEGAWVFHRAIVPGVFASLLDELRGDDLSADDARLAVAKDVRRRDAEAYFSENANEWDDLRGGTIGSVAIEGEIERLIAALHPPDGTLGRLVDLGTGTGRMLSLLSAHFDEGVGYDTNPKMLTVARSNLDRAGVLNARVRRGDLFDLADDGADDDADVVILHHVLHYLTEPFGAVAAASSLCTAGHLLIADLAPHDREQFRDRHAHRRLGFADDEVAGWAKAIGRRVTANRSFPLGTTDVTAKIWMLSVPTGTRSEHPHHEASYA